MKTKIVCVLMLISSSVLAQKEAEKTVIKPAAVVVAYGESISLENAKKVSIASEAFAVTNQWTVAIAIVDTGGNLILLHKLDNTQVASIDIAIGKAKTANNFKRPTKVMADAVANGGVGLRLLAVPNVFPLEGGEPIFSNGKIIGAIGVSGMTSTQDAEVVKAGLAVLK